MINNKMMKYNKQNDKNFIMNRRLNCINNIYVPSGLSAMMMYPKKMEVNEFYFIMWFMLECFLKKSEKQKMNKKSSLKFVFIFRMCIVKLIGYL